MSHGRRRSRRSASPGHGDARPSRSTPAADAQRCSGRPPVAEPAAAADTVSRRTRRHGREGRIAHLRHHRASSASSPRWSTASGRRSPSGRRRWCCPAGLTGLIGGFFWFVSRRIDARPEDRKDAEIADGAGELGFFSPGSYWPFGAGALRRPHGPGAGVLLLVADHHRRRRAADHRSVACCSSTTWARTPPRAELHSPRPEGPLRIRGGGPRVVPGGVGPRAGRLPCRACPCGCAPCQVPRDRWRRRPGCRSRDAPRAVRQPRDGADRPRLGAPIARPRCSARTPPRMQGSAPPVRTCSRCGAARSWSGAHPGAARSPQERRPIPRRGSPGQGSGHAAGPRWKVPPGPC